MTFEEILQQTIEILQNRGRVSYRALKRQFNLDDAYLDDLTYELIEIHQVAADQDGKMLVLTEESKPATSPVIVEPSVTQALNPHSYTPPHLVEKILTSHAALNGERKQVTVLFCDLASNSRRNLKPSNCRVLPFVLS